jgi:hypothetical protein
MGSKWWGIHLALRRTLPKHLAIQTLDKMYRGEVRVVPNGQGFYLVPVKTPKK